MVRAVSRREHRQCLRYLRVRLRLEPGRHQSLALVRAELHTEAPSGIVQRLLGDLPEVLVLAHQASQKRVFQMLRSPLDRKGGRIRDDSIPAQASATAPTSTTVPYMSKTMPLTLSSAVLVSSASARWPRTCPFSDGVEARRHRFYSAVAGLGGRVVSMFVHFRGQTRACARTAHSFHSESGAAPMPDAPPARPTPEKGRSKGAMRSGHLPVFRLLSSPVMPSAKAPFSMATISSRCPSAASNVADHVTSVLPPPVSRTVTVPR